MATFAIGDVQGCDAQLGALLAAIDFSVDRDHLWFVGDLVNRGPESLAALRRIRSMGDAATVVLGNHDLHLLAVAFGVARLRGGDTLQDILTAPDRDALLEWLIHRPLLHEDAKLNLSMLHAGLPPQWDMATARACAREVESALRRNPREVVEQMYGDEPGFWDDALDGPERLRYVVNCFTRLRYVDAHGRLALRAKGSPGKAAAKSLVPWFEAPDARWHGARVVFGHWSTLGYLRNAHVISLDTGCVWGGSLTALRLDTPGEAPIHLSCPGFAAPAV